MKHKVVVFGLSITSSWGNRHAFIYRNLLREVAAKGHEVAFVERKVPRFEGYRDLPHPSFCDLVVYDSLGDLNDLALLDNADFAIVGSAVPDGVAVGEWVLREARCPVAFYDLDTAMTIAELEKGECEYLSPKLIGRYALYLSIIDGRILERLMLQFGSPKALTLECPTDPSPDGQVASSRAASHSAELLEGYIDQCIMSRAVTVR